MSLTIKYLLLLKAELEYEVALRGGDITGITVVELRKQILKLTAEIPADEILESHLDANEDLAQAKVSLERSRTNLDKLKTKLDKTLCTRTETLLNHLYYRLLRIEQTEADAAVYADFDKQLTSQHKEFAALKQQVNQLPTLSNEPLSDMIAVSCEKKMVADVLSKLKFSGKTCVRSFLQKVDDIVRSRNIPKGQVLQFAYEIFTEDALHWYRYISHKVSTWDEVVFLLKRDFSKSDYDYRLLSEIRLRTQGEKENITIYLSIMHGMFSRLDKQPSEDEKLEILLHNIRPCYASTLATSVKISTIDALADTCKSYENIQARMSQFHEPPKVSSETVAPEFAYNKPSTSTYEPKPGYPKTNHNNNKNYENNYNQYKTNNEERKYMHVNSLYVHSNNYSKKYCPRCRSDTHSLYQCDKPREIICFKCGKKGVRLPDCPVCRPTSITKN